MSNHEEDFVIINKEDVSDETILKEFEKESKGCVCSEHLSNAYISNDEAIARELQNQINRDYNENLKRFENGTSKLIISYEKYRKYDCYDGCSEDDYEEFDPMDDVDWDRFEAVDKTYNSLPPCGYLFNKDGTIVTKHDVSLNGQRNMKKLMSLPPNIETGDGTASHMEISNSVLNGLKLHSQNKMHHENVCFKEKNYMMQRKFSNVPKICLDQLGLDSNTNNIIHGLLRGTNPCLGRIKGRLDIAKEAVIYCAERAPKTYNERSNVNCILKLFKSEYLYYPQHGKYLADDYRYKDRYNPKMSMFSVICLWTEKERDNLELLKKCNILCPEPIKQKDNVLVMSFIGKKGKPAKNLGMSNLTTHEYHLAYQQIIKNMKIMYKKAQLVHADLNEYNVLWYKQKCYFIDVCQAVDIAHTEAFEYLKRDCRNIINFFDRKNVAATMNKEELFKFITNKDWDDRFGLPLLTLEFQRRRKLKSNNDHKLEELRARSKPKLVGV